ncbi:MAG: hypothetical protein PHC28_08585 [Flavobacterium sp.]|uniref:hypothetical protein n=1 Tax=Flavobacterium sp. TaxID=239 RepID=UPI002620D25B|nr:hypothetical protein [Flavobacterium sp.]MDD5150524.1 hypothetical protein [Flavobacterium sp.]
MATDFETIEKESIQSLKFPNNEVLQDNFAINQRKTDLHRAQSLGNLERSKTRIYFEDNQSKKMVETTVWAVTDKSVILKKGVGIPINRIFMSL